MRIISFVSKKGGVGKSTITCALALYLSQRAGKSVAVQDMETGGGSSAFVESAQLERLVSYSGGHDHDYLLIDTEGNASDKEIGKIESLADLVVLPMEITPLEIAKTYDTIGILKEPGKARLLFNKVRKNTTAWKDRDDSVSLLQIKPLTTAVHRRTCYARFLVGGAGELNRAAWEELELLAWELAG